MKQKLPKLILLISLLLGLTLSLDGCIMAARKIHQKLDSHSSSSSSSNTSNNSAQ